MFAEISLLLSLIGYTKKAKKGNFWGPEVRNCVFAYLLVAPGMLENYVPDKKRNQGDSICAHLKRGRVYLRREI